MWEESYRKQHNNDFCASAPPFCSQTYTLSIPTFVRVFFVLDRIMHSLMIVFSSFMLLTTAYRMLLAEVGIPCNLLASWGYFSWTSSWVRVASA